ncbi:lon protease homolog 1, mitochondrial-like isoform X4 [Rutidosis leptorrhynchoides]|uniref:lon protease homolog 1, mitochondrial-like isoform X4 n=1 Tax=Rutidosis leptorrhynchoides TaxID=125765 RepID=UPI003A995EB7
MELLDPEKNGSFMDHYLSILINLYKMQVLLICTTNVLGTIPNPLRARIEIIHIYGYNLDENVCIARDYLEKRARVVSGIKVDQREPFVLWPKTIAEKQIALQLV